MIGQRSAHAAITTEGATTDMLASVIIPTRGRPEILARAVAALGDQSLARGEYEVLLGTDGHDPASEVAARRAWPHDPGLLTIAAAPHAGQASVRNRLLPLARGRVIVFLNDDVIAERGLVEAHATDPAHSASASASLVLGATPWRLFEPDSLFRRLVRETSMVFFYYRMDEHVARVPADAASDDGPGRPDADRDWGFRHAWLLNLSIRADLVRAVGGLSVFPSTYGFEDDDLAWRLRERFAARVLYRPNARGHHDHRMSPAEYLRREYRLGYAAWGFANQSPRCANDLFGRDITNPGELAYAREFVFREAAAMERVHEVFRAWDSTPADAVRGRWSKELMHALYQQHLPLKRWCWRAGLIDAAARSTGAGDTVEALLGRSAEPAHVG